MKKNFHPWEILFTNILLEDKAISIISNGNDSNKKTTFNYQKGIKTLAKIKYVDC